MNTTTGGSEGPGWVDVSACTLPTAQRSSRLAEFDHLFRSALRSIDRTGDTHARLLLAGSDVAARTQRLVDAESSCCSFFTFGVATPGPGAVTLDVEVPAAYADVLGALVDRAHAVLGGAA